MSLSPTRTLLALFALGPACNAWKDGADDSGDSGDPTVAGFVHCDPITEDELWTAGTHQVLCDLEIEGAVVTLEPGVEVKVDPNVRIFVGRDGARSGFVAEGSADEPITFGPSVDPEIEGSAGWGGIGFYEGAAQAQLSHVTVDQGGASLDAAVWVEGAELLAEDLSVTNSASVGLRLVGDARLAEGSTGLSISGSATEPAWVESHVAHTLPTAGSTYSGNGDDGVVVERGPAIEGDVTWGALGVPYVIIQSFDVNGSAEAPATLRVAPGAVLLFEEDTGLNVAAQGGSSSLFIGEVGGEAVTLSALADASEPGLWDGVTAEHGTLEVELHNVTIELGGQTSNDGAGLQVQGDVEVVLDGVDVSGSLAYGLYLRDGAWLSEDSGDITISGCGWWPVRVRADAAHTIPPEDYTGNTTDGVLVDGGTVDQAVVWEDLGVPYVISGDVRLNGYLNETSTLTIEAGTELLFDSGASIQLANSGGESGLFAEGRDGEEIVMSALLADEDGFWDGVSAERGVPEGSLRLEHVIMNWGGDTNFDAMLKVVDTDVYVDQVTLSNSSSLGFLLGGTARFAEGSQGLTLANNREDGELPAGQVHTLPEDLRFQGRTAEDGRSRTYHALFVNGTSDPIGSVTWPALLDVDSDEDGRDDQDGAYWILNSFYLTGTAELPAVLTLEAGTQLWMGDNTAIYVSTNGGAGGLIADASGGDPIVFTAAEANVEGRWQGIKIYDHCLDEQVILDNVRISYGGGRGDILPDGNLVLNGCDATLNDVTVEYSAVNGLLMWASPTIQDSVFQYNLDCGIQVNGGDPDLSNASYIGNGAGGICY